MGWVSISLPTNAGLGSINGVSGVVAHVFSLRDQQAEAGGWFSMTSGSAWSTQEFPGQTEMTMMIMTTTPTIFIEDT